MESNSKRAWCLVDLNKIKENLTALYKRGFSEANIIAVVKSDGYGHGAVRVSQFIENESMIWGFAVACGDEAFALRKAGIKKPIMLLGAAFDEEIPELIENDIRLCLYSTDSGKMIDEAAVKLGKKAIVHVKIDTGMGRIGFSSDERGAFEIQDFYSRGNMEFEGIFTHFARADEEDKQFTSVQIERFEEIVNLLETIGISFKYHHCSNSAGIIESLGSDKELIRAGISMYGLYPSDDVNKDMVKLSPALELRARVSHVKDIEPGTPISYGGTFVSFENMKVATVTIGYGDGYPRGMSGKGSVIIRGKRAKILGRVCMDQIMVDVTGIPDVKFGDEVVLLGKDVGETITAEEIMQISGRFHYELLCDIGKRIPRIYIKE